MLGTLDAKTANTSLTIPGLATLSLGQLTSSIAADGTSAAGQAALLNVAVGVAPLPLNVATLSIAPSEVLAHVPAGGVFCPPPTNPLEEAHKDASAAVVAPGQQFTYTVTVPNRGTCTLTNVHIVDTVTGPAGTTVVSSTPPESSESGLTLTYNDIGPLAPNETKNIQILMQGAESRRRRRPVPQPRGTSPPSARVPPAGTTPFSKRSTSTLPAASCPASAGCHLDDSNKAADHIKVFDGETFNYYIHVLNDGTSRLLGRHRHRRDPGQHHVRERQRRRDARRRCRDVASARSARVRATRLSSR